MVEATRTLRLGHSPDADDAFMFFGLGRGPATGLAFEHVIQDIETLNRRALRGELEVTAVSVHTLAFVASRYALLRCGASVGEGYGPRVVARSAMALEDLAGARIAIPGALTTASLALRLRLHAFEAVPVPFDQVLDVVARGDVKAGLVIHEGQLTYRDHGLELVEDLGVSWTARTGLPLPLGVNVVRRDLSSGLQQEIGRSLRASIELSLRERPAALAHAATYGRGIDAATLDQFVRWYVNDRTLDLGADGLAAIRRLLGEAAERGLVPSVRPELLDFVC
jgi:1,4-dihydroxy-6-naphthoate synthase